MMTNLFFHTPSQPRSWLDNHLFLRKTLLTLVAVLLIAIASQVSIPLNPVPLTFQSAAVILIGMTYGARQGTIAIASYLLAGALGFPVFADYSGGLAYFLHPSSGYLLGFLPGAFLSGFLAEHGFAKNSMLSFIAAALGASLIFITGVSFLSQWIGWHAAIQFGVLPFIITEPLKLAAVALLTPRVWKKAKQALSE